MNATRLARIAALTLSIVVLGASGAYLVLYLYRWEWNRAEISGIVFIAALTTVSAGLVLRAIHGLDVRLARLERSGRSADAAWPTGATSVEETAAMIRTANRSRPARRFAWLARPRRGPWSLSPSCWAPA